MNFSLTKEQSSSRAAARKFVRSHIAPGRSHRGQEFHELLECLGAQGFMGMTVPERYGGGGKDEVSHALTLMEVSKRSAPAGGLLVWNNSLYSSSILRYGKEEQKSKYLPLSSSGEKPGCMVLLDGGMPVCIRCTVVAGGADRRIRGEGCFFPCGIPFGIAAALSHDGKSIYFIIVDLDNSEGMRRGEAFDTGGIFLSGIAETIFEDARLESDAILCSGGRGPIQCALQDSWLGVGALAVGIGQGALEEGLDFARDEQGAGRVFSQAAEWKLADMSVELEASEILVLKAAWMKDRGKSYEKEAAAAKAFAAAAAVKASFEALQMLGTNEPGKRISIERRMRDAEACGVYYGTREQLDFVAAGHLGRGGIIHS